MLSRISRQTWINIALAAVLAAGVGYFLYRKYHKEEVPERVALPEADPVPIATDPEGWKLTTDATLILEPTPTVRISPVGKYIDTPAVMIVPTNRAGWTHMVRPRQAVEEKAVIRLIYNRIPLKVSKQVRGDGDEVFLTENDVLGASVTTLPIKAGTVIMPPQSMEVVDQLGKVVLRHPAG
jgi:hypothetical protein